MGRGYNGISWAQPGGEQGAYDYMSSLLSFNQSHPSSQRFDGVHMDVEEYTSTWLGVLQNIWAGATLAQLKQMDPSFKLGVVAIPALWWGTEERRQQYAYKLQDYTDYIAVMSYFQGDRTLNFFTGPSKPAIDYAGKTGKKIYLGLEVSVWRGEGECFPGWEYMSFASLGKKELAHRIDRINAALGKYPGFGGVAIETHDAYRQLCLVQDEIDSDTRLYAEVDSTAEPLPQDLSRVSISGFTTRRWHGSEDPAVKTQMASFDIVPAFTPGHVLSFTASFGQYEDTRPNPLTEETVPAELLWLGFLDTKADVRPIRVDYNGSVGIRVMNKGLQGVPADQKDLLRISYDRFRPQVGETYECRLHFFSDSRIMLKVIDPQKNKVVWHSERMSCDQDNLGRMYVEIADKPPWGSIVYDQENRTINLYKGDTVFAKISDLRCGSLF